MKTLVGTLDNHKIVNQVRISKLLSADAEAGMFKATFHLTISMRGKRATGKIQRNNYRHGSFGPSLTSKTMSVFLIFTQGTHRNVKNR